MTPATGVTAEMETLQESRASESGPATQLVVCLGALYEDAPAETLTPLLDNLGEALAGLAGQTMIAYPSSDAQASSWEHAGMTLQPYLPSARLPGLAVQTATSFLSLFEVMRAHAAACGVLLGPEAHTLHPAAIRGLVTAVLDRKADLALPRYTIGPNEGLINRAILHPLTRSVFNVRAGFPLALDLAVSSRMAERLAGTSQRSTAASQPDALVWPVAEAAVAGFTIAEVDAGVRELPHPAGNDLTTLLATIATSLFSDIEAKATYWQRTRPALPLVSIEAVAAGSPVAEPVPRAELEGLIESFRIAYGNLHEIWSLVLPPQTLLGLKRISRLTVDDFAVPDALWVRVVYDFVLAHRLRTINRGHLMGALTPLYLAWVASHILAGESGTYNAEALVRAFEADKPYLVSRWRWPDRFNP
jgi:hypothetical protein